MRLKRCPGSSIAKFLARETCPRLTVLEIAMQILVLEDDVLIAMDLAATLKETRASAQGPLRSAEQAALAIARRKNPISRFSISS